MSTDGNWNLIISTPMGERQATLSIKAEGVVLKGSQAAEGKSAEIFDGNVDADTIVWKVSITNPIPIRLSFLVRSKAIALGAPLFSAHSGLPRFLARARVAPKFDYSNAALFATPPVPRQAERMCGA
jgi:hypothetical protein